MVNNGSHMFKSIRALLIVVVLLVLAACSGATAQLPAPEMQPGDQSNATGAASSAPGGSDAATNALRIGVPFLSQPLDPASGGGFNAVQFGVGETLIRLDETFAPVPWLAESITPASEREWTITLRADLRFGDGTPITAEAVKASLDRSVAEDATAGGLLGDATIDVIDERTLRMTTAEATPQLPGMLTDPSLTIVHVAAAQQQGAAFAQKPIMSGPFSVETFVQDQELVLVRNANYWGAPAAADRIEISVLPDANARMLALQSGQLDIAIDIRPESVAVAENDANLRVVRAEPVATTFMYLNHTKPAWQDRRVRQALAHAVPPRDALLRTVLRGEGVAGVGPIPPAVLPCDGLQPPAFDPDRARALLAEAGYRDTNGDGYVEKNGQELTMQVITYLQRPILTPMAEIVQSNLRDVGIRMMLQNTEQINEALANQDWDGAMYFNNMAATGDAYGSLATFYATGGASNRGGYVNETITDQIAQLRPVADRDERRERACAISQALLDDVAIIPLVYPNYSYGVSTSVSGFDSAHPYFLYFINGAMSGS
jgi:peptide/nickel transport system substrate-binding protein